MYKIFFAFLSVLILPVAASASQTVLINEINWMGSASSANHEWIELYNPGGEPINLTGWQLKALDGTPSINLSGAIAGGDYYLLERTNDNSAPGAIADLFYTGALGNAGEDLILKDAEGNTIDSVSQAGLWLGGDNITKQTMERVNATVWVTSLISGGTPKAKNSTVTEPEEPEDTNEEESQEENDETENNNGTTDEESNETNEEVDQTEEETTETQPTRCEKKVSVLEKRINKQLPDVICQKLEQRQERIKNRINNFIQNLKNRLADRIRR
jgi:hypothetical protein